MREVFICQICKEPINNYVCIDGLSGDIKRWLPEGLSGPFSRFNRQLSAIFHCPYDLKRHHIVCNSKNSGNICLYCYVNEVFQWLMWRNKAVARRFRKLFSFGMRDTEFRDIVKAHAEPISEAENMEEEFGICDECGEYADELHLINGRWICRECYGD